MLLLFRGEISQIAFMVNVEFERVPKDKFVILS